MEPREQRRRPGEGGVRLEGRDGPTLDPLLDQDPPFAADDGGERTLEPFAQVADILRRVLVLEEPSLGDPPVAVLDSPGAAAAFRRTERGDEPGGDRFEPEPAERSRHLARKRQRPGVVAGSVIGGTGWRRLSPREAHRAAEPGRP